MLSPVRKMFDEISKSYDFLNHTLSCFQDILWRKACCRELKKRGAGKRLLDLCGGTGDFAVEFERIVGKPSVAILGDFSFGMLEHSCGKKTSAKPVQLDAMQMPFCENSFDVILNGFGMRNLPNAAGGLEESHRVLSAGGYLMVLDFFSPRNFFNRFFYKCLAPLFIPLLGSIFSGKRSAYEYLINSVLRFLPVSDFANLAKEKGFRVISIKPCFFGIAYRVLLQKGKTT
ncbi:ubiquinone/menaquinone biosynthesis methyltransferase [Hallerella porci]|uniref:Demethylmenaquinone methyltransferase/2-methoxy-6-polyprenyl-1,4-benzoquinol methylase n=1 Tax=Hallerella porci TaxID=1945871 RepID=A0ABX5LNE9_9BACT|nr:ubiquinone/menaquinone biosynthesis methyltransferase [Hallerella porci]PWK99201.1 demethylmenaquinone methyltransferase/2-methoxy-6-polyprenyl-1,4-benzoquinol methylase [Hallerella porci]